LSTTNSARQAATSLLQRLETSPDADDVEAFGLAEQALAHARRCADKILEARALQACGHAAASARTVEQALQFHSRAQAIWSAHGLQREQVRCKVDIARVLQDQAEPDAAISLLSVTHDDTPLTQADHLRIQLRLAVSHLNTQHLGRAAACASAQMLQTARQLREPDLLAEALLIRALLLLAIRLFQEGIETYLTSGVARDFQHPEVHLEDLDALLSEAESLPCGGQMARHFQKMRWAVAGVFSPRQDVTAALMGLTSTTIDRWPTCAAMAMLIAGMLSRIQGRPDQSVAPLAQSLTIALRLGHLQLLRCVLFEQSLAFSALGRHDHAYGALRKLYALHTPWVSLGGPTPSPGEGAMHATHAACALRGLDLRSAGTNDNPGLDAAGPRVRDDPDATKAPEPAHVRRAVAFIDAQVGTRLRVTDIALHCGISRRTLEVAFKRAKGITVLEHIKRRKFEVASEKLRNTNTPLRDIAASLGYPSASAFSRDFRHHFGFTPMHMRKQASASASGVQAQPPGWPNTPTDASA
jgi:AraC-like DNA-binding protein/tetratricopeptide (TPR) repeat protein